MKFKKSVIVNMVKEEYRRIREAGEKVVDSEEDKKKNSTPKDPPKDASKEPSSGKKSADDKKKPDVSATPKKNSPSVPELPVDDQPADDELEDQETGPEEDDTEKKEAKSKISDEIVGKSVQSITMEPKSKVLPGAQEIVLTFDQVTDPLRILVTKTGKVAFFFRGLHNEI